MFQDRDAWLQMFFTMYAPINSEHPELLLSQYQTVIAAFSWDVLRDVLQRYLLSEGVETSDNFAPVPPRLSTFCRKVKKELKARAARLDYETEQRALPPTKPDKKFTAEELAHRREFVAQQRKRLKF